MKKSSLMGASVVAAALLAVAPVAAPAISSVSGVQTVNAATSSAKDETANNVFRTVGSYNSLDTSKDSKILDNSALETTLEQELGYDGKNVRNIVEFTNSSGVAFNGLLGKIQAKNNTVASNSIVGSGDSELASGDGYNVAVTESYSNGSQSADLYNDGDIAYYARQALDNGGTFKINYTVVNGNNKYGTTSVSINVPKPDTPQNISSLYVTTPSEINASLNDDVAKYEVTSSAKLSAVDQNGNDVPAFSNGRNVTSVKVQRTTDPNNGTWENVSGKLVAADGQGNPYYYRQVATVSKVGTAGNNNGTGNDTKVYVNHALATLTDGSFNVVTPIKVSNDANVPSKSEKINGVVTVNPDVKFGYAQLHRADGKLIPSRVLPANTAWYTDTKLTTLADGKQYYRVATTEYVAASDVSYAAKSDDSSSDSSSDSSITNTVAEDGAFTTKNDGFYTATFKIQDGKFVANMARVLAPGTSWRYDKKANFGGDTYYKVTPTLWLSSVSGSAQPY
ncbi:SLAP domain-containing protein [Bombilactobacillus folatiphilus]|uniref:SLAP domain-containing protein n=1 Tax=Bombilactobacillus folatiphilus TaxID=2923362 RepID=A0ABY4P8I3_9LACO|nr:SLAP domain-containing protein [Bombilactobacillus folatiphilus]UQS81947.1 SLAP domain-containing protein [Bombilactobacillus folatiphilus]